MPQFAEDRPIRINRRQSLQLLAAGGMGLGWGVQNALAEDKVAPKFIIDTHTHFFDPTRPQGVPWPAKNSPLYQKTVVADFRKVAEPHGVTGTVVVEASPWVEDNQWILDLAKDDPYIVGLVGNLKAGEPEFAGNLKRFAQNPLFCGIRIRGAELEGWDPQGQHKAYSADLTRLAEQNLAIDVLGPPSMLPDVLRLADTLPKLRMVINHLPQQPLGNPAKQAEADAALVALAERPQVFAKISNVLRKENDQTITDLAYYQATLDRLWKLFGQSRVIYGSNWAVSRRAGTYAQLFQVVWDYVTPQGQEFADLFFWKNAKTAYHWVER